LGKKGCYVSLDFSIFGHQLRREIVESLAGESAADASAQAAAVSRRFACLRLR
jgi:hypothetical protein